MSIKHIETKIKADESDLKKPPFFRLDNDTFMVIVILLVAFTSFGIGRLSTNTNEKTPILFSQKTPAPSWEQGVHDMETTKQPSPAPQKLSASAHGSLPDSSLQTGSIVVSKNGTKYHFPWCSGAKRIKEENKIWFNSEQEAREAGYTPAANCKGLK